MAHPELGSKILDDVLEQVGGDAKVETQARLDGRNMTMVLAPDKKALAASKAATDRQRRPDAADAPDAERRPGRRADRRHAPHRRHRSPTPAGPVASPAGTADAGDTRTDDTGSEEHHTCPR